MAGGTLAPPTAVHWATKGTLIGSGHTESRPASERGGIPYVIGFSVQEGPNTRPPRFPSLRTLRRRESKSKHSSQWTIQSWAPKRLATGVHADPQWPNLPRESENFQIYRPLLAICLKFPNSKFQSLSFKGFSFPPEALCLATCSALCR